MRFFAVSACSGHLFARRMTRTSKPHGNSIRDIVPGDLLLCCVPRPGTCTRSGLRCLPEERDYAAGRAVHSDRRDRELVFSTCFIWQKGRIVGMLCIDFSQSPWRIFQQRLGGSTNQRKYSLKWLNMMKLIGLPERICLFLRMAWVNGSLRLWLPRQDGSLIILTPRGLSIIRDPDESGCFMGQRGDFGDCQTTLTG